ncbi:UTP--glucose-1-phosphate uridylyltransferase [Teladorsagia circumcincta]|uniref:UTP--glucose-1-phosphate uridylyltransferase n=1 Tax=Teladorsagia circumcincta TaxID=45464 RepID=A0A2G9UQE4_TELCI|nr:UTP--glucose-1-phosphate uridylyltransferase [Teladorsagia circumcincta]
MALTKSEWYPPGHGNIFQSLEMTGFLDELLKQGRDIMLVSNIDNTGATLDLKIAQFACDEDVEYIMECTEKTENDIKDLNGRSVIQLETSIGGCIKNFPRAYCVHVNRRRFLPVKKVDDLLAISSNLYTLNDAFTLQFTRNRPAPIVELGSSFQRVDDFHARFDDYPDMQDLDSLKVEGDVRFERDVVLKGDVTIVNKTTKQQVISAGSVLDNEQVVYE